jgi:hypothetical protein
MSQTSAVQRSKIDRRPLLFFGRNLRLFLASTFILCIAARPIHAAVKIASFSDHMVLQRDRPISVWGTAAAGAIVKVQLGDKSACATAEL